MSRPAIAHIRLDAFRHNYRIAKRLHGGKALAVIKANAYGHGAVQCARAIESEADGYAVATIEEALLLRQAGISLPILLLEGFFEESELSLIVEHDFWIVVHHLWQVNALRSAKLNNAVHVWLKMDSGMHRVGLSPADFSEAYALIKEHPNVASIVVMSHFANADNLTSQHTIRQKEVFYEHAVIKTAHIADFSLANSAAILGWQETKSEWSRPGIMLYGANPLNRQNLLHKIELRAVMQLTSKIISTRMVTAGESIGYGSIYTAERDTVVGVVACGYADGYPRSAGTGTPVAVDGNITQLIGRVSMDMLFVDLTDIPTATIGSHVELWGDQVAANDVASAAGTIAYEIFCNVKRVKFEYSDN